MSIDYIADSFSRLFDESEHEELEKYLEELETDTVWEPVSAKETYFLPLSEVEETDLSVGAGFAYKDSRSNELPIAAVLPDGRKYLMRPYLLKNIKQHHKDEAKVLTEMVNTGRYDAFCEHVSLGRSFLKGNITMLLRGEKISGWFSDFNHNWSQAKQLDFFEKEMYMTFPNISFMGADVSHYFTSAYYQLDSTIAERELGKTIDLSASVLNSYVDAWVKAGFAAEDLEEARPICQFITGESGLTSVEVRPYLILKDNTVIPLGNKLSVNHRGSDEKVWSKFETFPEEVCVLYQKGLAGIERLCEQKIVHPYSATTHVLNCFKSSGITAALKICAAEAEIFWPPDEEGVICNAIDIFNCVNRAVSGAKTSPMRKLVNAETLGRLLHADWSQFDVKTPSSTFCKKPSVESDDLFGV